MKTMINLNEYPYITENQGELNYVSYLEKNEVEFIVSESVNNYPFGSNEKDSIEVYLIYKLEI